LFYFYFHLFILFDLNCASCAAPQHAVAAPGRAPDFVLFDFIYSFLFEWCIRCRSARWSRGTRRGTRLFVQFFLFFFNNLNGASGVAPQQAVVAPDGGPDFLLL
jgi:NADH:ubiquinone oxidoreductase subunit 3 (subunit A)